MDREKLFLAPMEGVTDWVMRDTLTALGGIDQCVTEFLRVTDRVHSDTLFFKNCPELKTGSKTRAGTPVFIQLLGGQPQPLAENAVRAHELGALGIDLNFGCPAKTVNRHDGGATLLKSCHRLFDIISTVRKAVPVNTPVTAKIRLGFDDPSACLENAIAVQEAGAAWLTVHCRTKTDGYKPPAYWEWIPKIKEKVSLPIVANGEIWTVQDFEKCKQQTDCHQFMIGRGALRNPFLFQEIKMTPTRTQPESLDLLPAFFDACTVYASDYFAVARTKQWLAQLKLTAPLFAEIFEEVKIIKEPDLFKTKLLDLIAKSTNPTVTK